MAIKFKNLTIGDGLDTTDATATGEDIRVGKTAYANKEKIEGTIEDFDGAYEGGEQIIGGGALIKVGSSGTTVPNSGYVDKVYFNTSMSIDEVMSLCSGIPFNDIGNQMDWMLVVNGETSLIIQVTSTLIIWNGISRMIYFSSDVNEDAGITFKGWNPDFDGVIEVNNNVASENNMLPNIVIGSNNESLKDLFSLTPFVEGEDIVLEGEYKGVNLSYDMPIFKGTPVPNSGYVEKVYFNTDMSVEQVVNLLSKITYNIEGFGYAVIADETNENMIAIYGAMGWYAIMTTQGFIFSSANNEISAEFGVDFVGWAEGFDGVIEFNAEAIPSLEEEGVTTDIGYQNNALSSLISTTPFEKTNVIDVKSMIDNKEIPLSIEVKQPTFEGTPVPTTGYVGNIYFNTSMSVDEVVALLDQLNIENEAIIIIISDGLPESLLIGKSIRDGINEYNITYTSTRTDITTTVFTNSQIFEFYGWNPKFNGVINYSNSGVIEPSNVNYISQQNELLKNLISITPFKGTNNTHKFITLNGTPIDGGFDFGEIDEDIILNNSIFWSNTGLYCYLEWALQGMGAMFIKAKALHRGGDLTIHPSCTGYLGDLAQTFGLYEYLTVEIDTISLGQGKIQFKTNSMSGSSTEHGTYTIYPNEVVNQFVGMTSYIKLHLLVKE